MNNARQKKKDHSQLGSAFFYILLGVVLFATLAYVLSRSFKGTATNAMTERQAELAATDMINYAQTITRAVDKIRRKGCSENDISFDHSGWGHANYRHSPVVDNECKVFHPAGGGISFEQMNKYHDKHIDSMARYIFSARSEITDIGRTCADDSCVELYLYVRMFNAEKLCKHLNKMLFQSASIPSSSGVNADALFNGTYAYASTLNQANLNGKIAACYEHATDNYSDGSSYYDFYYVLLER